MASTCGLFYNIQVTGDCSNNSSGAFSVSITGSAPDYTIQFISPNFDVYYLGSNVTTALFPSLSAGTYVFEILDSCQTASTPTIASVNISTGTTVTISNYRNTTNNQSDGALTAQTSNFYNVSSFYLYDYDYGYISSGNSITDSFTFEGLSAATYFVIADDGGGCTGQSETIIIQSSDTFDYGFYVVDDSSCIKTNGKIFITGLTGYGPYSYLWSNGQTTSSISGLTRGIYSVQVTDRQGGIVTKSTQVNLTPPLTYVNSLILSPTCYGDDGSVRFIIDGGTPPYNYQLSNGFSNVSFLEYIDLVNLEAGKYTMTVIDSGLCTLVQSFSLNPNQGFSVEYIRVKNTTCSLPQGEISISLIGGTNEYIFTLISSDNNRTIYRSNSPSMVISNLVADNYILEISNFGQCVFTEEVIVGTVNTFEITSSVSGTSCNNETSYVEVQLVGTGVPPYTYSLNGQPNITKSSNFHIFENIEPGNHLLSVTDSLGCLQTENIFIPETEKLNFSLKIDNSTNSNGKVEVYITKGKPPFYIDWGSNLGPNSGLTKSNLAPGNYEVSITDDNGCTQARNFEIPGWSVISSYQIYNVCDNDITYSGDIQKRGLQQMLSEGFYDLTSEDSNCVLNQSLFSVVAEVSGVTYQEIFFTGTSLNEFPSDNIFYNTVESILLNINGIEKVIFNSSVNQIVINTGCENQTITLIDSEIIISVLIEYDITCSSCGGASVEEDFPLITTTENIFALNVNTNEFIQLPKPIDFVTSLGATIDDTVTKLWVLDESGLIIFEYDIISMIPFNIELNRGISLSTQVSRGLVWINSTTLLTGVDSSMYINYVDIVNGDVTPNIFISSVPNTVVDKSILVNNIGKIIILTNNIDGLQFLRQFDVLGTLEVEISLPATIGYTMYEFDSVFYLVDLSNYQAYSILTSTPYTLTASHIISPPETTSVFIMSQIKTYVTTNFT